MPRRTRIRKLFRKMGERAVWSRLCGRGCAAAANVEDDNRPIESCPGCIGDLVYLQRFSPPNFNKYTEILFFRS